jgi:hypothetical protein
MDWITREDMQKLLDAKAEKLSSSVVGHLRWHLNAIFKMAQSDGVVEFNPAAALFTPACKASPEKRVMSGEEVILALTLLHHPSYGLPWGQDRLVPIFLATLAVRQQSRTITFTSAADMLETFGMQQGGSQYRRLVAAFQRIFGATIFFGTDTQSVRANVFHHARFNFMSEAQISCSRLPADEPPPGKLENLIVLSQEFYKEIMDHLTCPPKLIQR